MSPHDLAQRFLLKGEQDLAAAFALVDHEEIADDIVGFHCQQAVEKFLQAVLATHQVVFRRTHDLMELMDLLGDQNLPVPDNRDALDELEPYAVTARYDFFDDPVCFDRQRAVRTADFVCQWVKPLL